eukprot:m.214932 g.214932  ORF g.214932 m.214932 type:complete len:52 (+) comp38271_c0_seq1:1336-1491(+)
MAGLSAAEEILDAMLERASDRNGEKHRNSSLARAGGVGSSVCVVRAECACV